MLWTGNPGEQLAKCLYSLQPATGMKASLSRHQLRGASSAATDPRKWMKATMVTAELERNGYTQPQVEQRSVRKTERRRLMRQKSISAPSCSAFGRQSRNRSLGLGRSSKADWAFGMVWHCLLFSLCMMCIPWVGGMWFLQISLVSLRVIQWKIKEKGSRSSYVKNSFTMWLRCSCQWWLFYVFHFWKMAIIKNHYHK